MGYPPPYGRGSVQSRDRKGAGSGGLELQIRAELDAAVKRRTSRHLAEGGALDVQWGRGAEGEGRVIEDVQEFALNREPDRLLDRDRLVHREVGIEPVRSV